MKLNNEDIAQIAVGVKFLCAACCKTLPREVQSTHMIWSHILCISCHRASSHWGIVDEELK